MTKSILHILAVAVVILSVMAGCSKPESFTVSGVTADGSETTVSMTWFDGKAVRRAEGRSVEGKFTIVGSAPAPTVAWLSDGSGRLFASFIVENGDKVKVTADLAEPVKSTVSGPDNAEEYAGWLASNAVALERDDEAAVNAAVARYVGAHPDSPVSTALIVWVFRSAGYELQADSLMRLLGPGARSKAITGSFPDMLASQLAIEATGALQTRTYPVGHGRTERFYPRESSYSMVAFTGSASERTDTLAPLFRRLTERYPRRRLNILQVSGAADSAEWARSVEADSTAKWIRTWAPTATADRHWRPYAVPSLPFFIIADSAGTQLLRTPSAAAAEDFIVSRLGRQTLAPDSVL